MGAWFRSQTGALELSFIALLSLLFRALFDTRYILPQDFQYLGERFDVVWLAGYTAVVGGWIWALTAAALGSRRALYGLLIYASLGGLLFGFASLILFADHLAEIILFSVSTLAGTLAALSCAALLRRRRMP
jgi:hypothetical protein